MCIRDRLNITWGIKRPIQGGSVAVKPQVIFDRIGLWARIYSASKSMPL
jgi:hypothetical protein